MRLRVCLLPLILAVACHTPTATIEPVVPAKPFEIRAGKPVAPLANEPHLRNVRQLTFDGENAEAYWSNDGTKLVFQRRDRSMPADQIYVLDLATGAQNQISTGKGRTTCSYFTQGDRGVIFASTHHHGDEPPVVKLTGHGYQWAIYQEFDIFAADPDGKNVHPLTDTPGYDAEATVSRVSGEIVFTSVRDGDLELYTMEGDGSNVHRVTNRPGYDGGAFFSPDGQRLVLRSSFPKDAAQATEDAQLLGQQIVRPSLMEITTCNRDGSNFKQLTHNGAANFAPYWFPDGKRIIFASNVRSIEKAAKMNDRKLMGVFNLFMMNDDGTGIEQVTDSPEFDSFPMFSPDGRHLVFASNRYGAQPRETNLFVAEWVN